MVRQSLAEADHRRFYRILPIFTPINIYMTKEITLTVKEQSASCPSDNLTAQKEP
jgi:hypothetical protein